MALAENGTRPRAAEGAGDSGGAPVDDVVVPDGPGGAGLEVGSGDLALASVDSPIEVQAATARPMTAARSTSAAVVRLGTSCRKSGIAPVITNKEDGR